MKLFMSVWWLSFPLADPHDTVTVCKRQENIVIQGETVVLTPGSAAGIPPAVKKGWPRRHADR
jgi:hypothetical protein